jgi:hypothetical protein
MHFLLRIKDAKAGILSAGLATAGLFSCGCQPSKCSDVHRLFLRRFPAAGHEPQELKNFDFSRRVESYWRWKEGIQGETKRINSLRW